MRYDFIIRPNFVKNINYELFFKNKKIGITGGSGNLGNFLIKSFFQFGAELSIFNGDIRNYQDVDNWISRLDFDYIFHLAAIVPIEKVDSNNEIAFEVNVNGTINLINCINSKVNKKIWVFFSSSSHVYKFNNNQNLKINESFEIDPINYYGVTKKLAEEYIIANLKTENYCIARIFSFTSTGQNKSFLIPSLIQKIKNNNDSNIIDVYNSNYVRDFLNIQDVISLILNITILNFNGIINIGSGTGYSIRHIAENLKKMLNSKIHFNYHIVNNPSLIISDSEKLKYLLSNLL